MANLYNPLFDMTVIKGTGSGSTKVFAKNINTGRNMKGDTFIFFSTNIAKSASVLVKIKGKPSFVDVDSTVVTTTATDKYITITGTSNSSNISIEAIGSPWEGLDLTNAIVTVGENTNKVGQPVKDDPGKDAEYTYTIKVPTSANKTGADRNITIAVMDSMGEDKNNVVCTQSKGTAVRTGFRTADSGTPFLVDVEGKDFQSKA